MVSLGDPRRRRRAETASLRGLDTFRDGVLFHTVMFTQAGPRTRPRLYCLTLAINYVQGVEDAFAKMQEGNANGPLAAQRCLHAIDASWNEGGGALFWTASSRSSRDSVKFGPGPEIFI